MRIWIRFISGILVAIMLSQFPEFFQQYRQRLGGTMDELNRQVETLDIRADNINMTRYTYVRYLRDSVDDAARQEGGHLLDLLTRHFSVQQALNDLEDAAIEKRALIILFHLDIKTAKTTAKDYQPALPLTIEGSIYALIGFILGYLLISFLAALLPKRIFLSGS